MPMPTSPVPPVTRTTLEGLEDLAGDVLVMLLMLLGRVGRWEGKEEEVVDGMRREANRLFWYRLSLAWDFSSSGREGSCPSATLRQLEAEAKATGEGSSGE